MWGCEAFGREHAGPERWVPTSTEPEQEAARRWSTACPTPGIGQQSCWGSDREDSRRRGKWLSQWVRLLNSSRASAPPCLSKTPPPQQEAKCKMIIITMINNIEHYQNALNSLHISFYLILKKPAELIPCPFLGVRNIELKRLAKWPKDTQKGSRRNEIRPQVISKALGFPILLPLELLKNGEYPILENGQRRISKNKYSCDIVPLKISADKSMKRKGKEKRNKRESWFNHLILEGAWAWRVAGMGWLSCGSGFTNSF